MSSPIESVDWALARLQSLANETRREGMSRYFTTSMTCLGVSVPQLRATARQLSRNLESESPGLVLAVAGGLLASGSLEARQTAFEVIAGHPATMSALQRRELEELGEGNDNWASVDCFSTLITGVLWLRGQLEDAVLSDWSVSPVVWWRRTAAVSTVPLNLKAGGGMGDCRRTLMVVDRLKHERHPMVAKAVSWALRALAARQPEQVCEYLERNRDQLASLVKREVGRKLEYGLKNPKSGKPGPPVD